MMSRSFMAPVVRAELQEALERGTEGPTTSTAVLQHVRNALADRITIPTSEGYHVLVPNKIVRCASDSNYTRMHMASGDKVFAARSLKEFDALWEPHGLMRVHLSHLVNMAQVKMYLHRDGGTLLLMNG